MKDHEVQILLVEDNKSDAALTIRALKKHNLANHLVHVIDGAEALDFIYGRGEFVGRNIAQTPKVIFLDLKMPKVSGLEVLKTLKDDEKTKHIPIVLMTSSKEEQDIMKSHELGVNSYVVKPVDFDSFTSVISELGFYWVIINNTP